MGKGNVFQQQYYGDGMWMESQAQQSYAFHEEYNPPAQYSHHPMQQPKPHVMDGHGYGYGHGHGHGYGYGHGHGMLTKPSGGYHAFGGGAVGGGKISNGGGKFNHLHHGGYNNNRYTEETEYEEFESYSEEQHYDNTAPNNSMHMNYAREGYHKNNPYEARMNTNTNANYMGYNNNMPTHGAHKYEWTAKGV